MVPCGRKARRHDNVEKMRFTNAMIKAANKATLQVWEGEGERQTVRGLNCLIYATGISLKNELGGTVADGKKTVERQTSLKLDCWSTVDGM